MDDSSPFIIVFLMKNPLFLVQNRFQTLSESGLHQSEIGSRADEIHTGNGILLQIHSRTQDHTGKFAVLRGRVDDALFRSAHPQIGKLLVTAVIHAEIRMAYEQQVDPLRGGNLFHIIDSGGRFDLNRTQEFLIGVFQIRIDFPV